MIAFLILFFFSSRRRHTRWNCDWSSDVCSSDLHHRQIPTYSEDDALKEMAEAGVDAAVIHPPSTLGEAMNALAVEAVKHHPDKFCILGNFDLEAPNREEIVKNWRQRPGMVGFRFTFNQPQQKAWWTDGSLNWFWDACEKQGYPVGLLAGGYMQAFGKI